MELVWMMPLYLTMPVTGIILLFKGFNADKGHGRKRIGFGFLLLSLPLLHAFLVHQVETRNEKALIGNYVLDSTGQIVLTLYADRTFELAKLGSINSFGKGKWQYRRWDIDEVGLTFSDSSQLWFEIVYQDKAKYLQNSFWTGKNHKYVKLVPADNKE